MADFRKVFMLAVKEAKKLREKHPKMTVAESVKKAWATDVVKKAKHEYDVKKKAAAKKK